MMLCCCFSRFAGSFFFKIFFFPVAYSLEMLLTNKIVCNMVLSSKKIQERFGGLWWKIERQRCREK